MGRSLQGLHVRGLLVLLRDEGSETECGKLIFLVTTKEVREKIDFESCFCSMNLGSKLVILIRWQIDTENTYCKDRSKFALTVTLMK